MTRRTIGIDLAIRGDHVAQIFDDGRPSASRSVFGTTPLHSKPLSAWRSRARRPERRPRP